MPTMPPALQDKVSEGEGEARPTTNEDAHGDSGTDMPTTASPDALPGGSDQTEADDNAREESKLKPRLPNEASEDDESHHQDSPRGVLDISIIANSSSSSSSSDFDNTGFSSTSNTDDSSPHASPPPTIQPPKDATVAAPESHNSQLQWKSLIAGLLHRKNKTAPVATPAPAPLPAPAPYKRASTFPPPTNASDLSSTSSSRWSFSRRLLRINSNRWLPADEDAINHPKCDPRKGTLPLGKWKPSWRNFDYQELVQATDNFSPEKLIGKGGHAEVYKGCLPDGQLVAVKRLTKKNNEEDRIVDFLSELGIIAHVNHPNAACLLGFGVEGGLHMVLKFSPHGSLASVLHGCSEKLDWETRFKIALGVAEGLLYLHEGCHRRIIHRDIKASNILLTEEYQPQISDFGLAKWLPDQWTHHVVFPIEGTFGYLAPEYFMHGVVSEKTDVFAYGVLLLELITGRKAIDSSRQSLVMWAKPLLDKMDLKGLVDPCLEGAFDLKEVTRSVVTASACIHHIPTVRPDMKKVVELLKGENGSAATTDAEEQKLAGGAGSKAAFFDDGDTEDYTCSRYLNDLHRHKQLALEQ